MDDEPALFESHLRSLPLVARGKVRENYAVGSDRLLMVASDRISAFDVVMGEPIPGKGKVLTEMALFWFARLGHIVPNHLTGDDPESVVADDEKTQVRGRSMLVRRLKPIPVEAVVRGYLAGSGWKEYQAGGSVCGVMLPPGLKNASKLPAPIFTPATKAEMGDHDENIDFARMSETIGSELAAQVRDIAIRLYIEAADFAFGQGIIIADTKFEFGLDDAGTLVLMDEVLTPDSSRYWPRSTYAEGINPPSFDKQYLRDWLESVRVQGRPWGKRPPAPPLPPSVLSQTAGRYREAFTRLVGKNAGLATAPVKERESRLVMELEAAIRSAPTQPEADCLRADLAAQFARAGRIDEAEAILAELRARYERSTHKQVTPWLNFAEATLVLLQGRGQEALIKMRRAHAIAGMSNLPLAGFAAASLAHMYWNLQDVELAVHYAKESLESTSDKEHRARCRVSMVIGEMFAMSRRESQAHPWLARARQHAMGAGDYAAASAVAFNLAVIQFDLLRQSMLDRELNVDRTSQVELFFRSFKEFNAIFRIPESDLNTMQAAEVMSLTGKHQNALNIYKFRVDTAKLASAGRRRSVWLSDMAWCLINVQKPEDARRLAAEAKGAIAADAQIDDLAVIHSRLALVSSALGDMAEADSHQALADDYWRRYRAFQDRCAALCEPFAPYLER